MDGMVCCGVVYHAKTNCFLLHCSNEINWKPMERNIFGDLLSASSYHMISHRIVSYRNVSCRIVSYRVVSYRIVSYPFTSYDTGLAREYEC